MAATAAAIVSNGPSARTFPACHYYSPVIAVRGASTLTPAAWVVEMDGTGIQHLLRDLGGPLGEPRWFVCHGAIEWLRGNDYALAEHLTHRHVWCWPVAHPGISSSGIAAIHLLRLLGLDAAACFGYDMVGSADCGGTENGTRQPERWRRERETIAGLVEQWRLELTFEGSQSCGRR